MKTRYLVGPFARAYREAASNIGGKSDYYDRMTSAVTEHIESSDFSRHSTTSRYPRKIAGLILKVVHGRPDQHVAIYYDDSKADQVIKQKMIDAGPQQAARMIIAFINVVSAKVLAEPEVRLPLKLACDLLPKAQREDLNGWMAAKLDL